MNERTPVTPTQHSLFQGAQPTTLIEKVFRVYPQEIKLLLWVSAIQLVMNTSSIMINNFAQTTFLKRFGVGALPTVYLIEAALTFFFAGLVGILMERFRAMRVFTGLLLFFGLAIGCVRALLPMEISLIYPALFILKSQAAGILPILYWEILGDLFTTQQSKRLYTLITAGGILGTTVGSLLTGKVAHWLGGNNILLIFIGGMALAALLNELTEKVAGFPIETRTDRRQNKLPGKFKDNLREFIDYTRKSTLLKYMILLLAIPNMILPMLDFQFNVLVDAHYATETGTLNFFGVFRGVSNAVIFITLLFSGRLISRWGVPKTMLIHPINYFFAFTSIFAGYNIVAGVYARFSTELLKMTLNNPARAILYNFFPERVRGLIRLFLRGGVVRAADFAGSGFLALVKGLVSPRTLPLLALPLVLVWIAACLRLKKAYPSMLAEILTERQASLHNLEEINFQALARNREVIEKFRDGLNAKDPKVAAVSGEFLARAKPPGWADAIIEVLPATPAEIQKQYLDLLGPEDVGPAMEKLYRMAERAAPGTLIHLLPALARFNASEALPVIEEFIEHPDPRVRVQALAGIYASQKPEALSVFRRCLQELLDGDEGQKRTAIEILSKTGDRAFSEELLAVWNQSADARLREWALTGLMKMKHEAVKKIALEAVGDSVPQIRKAVLDALISLEEKIPPEALIRFLGDGSAAIRSKAADAIRRAGEDVVEMLLPALAAPSRILKNEALRLFNQMGSPSALLSNFVIEQLKAIYLYLAYARVLNEGAPGGAPAFLEAHLLEKHREILENILRVVGVLEFGDRMKVILRAIQSGKRRDVDIAIEALEGSLHADISRLLLPILAGSPTAKQLEAGLERLGEPAALKRTRNEILNDFLRDPDPVIQTLSTHALEEGRRTADTSQYPTLIDRLACIRSVPFFNELPVRDLMSIVGSAEVQRRSPGEVIIEQGAPGDRIYLVCDGRIALSHVPENVREVLLDCAGKGECVGEMAVLDGRAHPYTVRVESEALLLVLEAAEFQRLMLDCPGISINICRSYSRRIIAYHSRLPMTKT